MNQEKFFGMLEKHGITEERAALLICRLNSLLESEEKKKLKTENAEIQNTPSNMEPVQFFFEENLTQKVTRLLTSWGFTLNSGFKYLRCSIIYCVNNGTNIPITKVLYPHVAKEFESKPLRVERAIRHSIEKVFNNHDTSLLELMGESIDPYKGKPTNGEFILFVADRIRNNLL